MRIQRAFLLLILTLALASSVSAEMTQTVPAGYTAIVNQTWLLNNQPTTPYYLWVGAIALAIVLIITSFHKGFDYGERGIVSVMAWFPAGFAFTTAFSVDQVTSYGATSIATNQTLALMEIHTIYHFDWIAYSCLLPLLILALLNTIGLYLSWKAMRSMAEPETRNNETDDSY